MFRKMKQRAKAARAFNGTREEHEEMTIVSVYSCGGATTGQCGKRKVKTHNTRERVMERVPERKFHFEILDPEQMPRDVPQEEGSDRHRAEIEPADAHAGAGDAL